MRREPESRLPVSQGAQPSAGSLRTDASLWTSEEHLERATPLMSLLLLFSHPALPVVIL